MQKSIKSVPSSDGTKIYAESNGNSGKRAIVLVHGFSLSSAVYDSLVAHPEFSQLFHLVRYDLRGHGRSDKPNGPEGCVSKLFADDFAAVCSAFGLTKPWFMGWSYGCSVLGDIAANLPSNFLSGAIYVAGFPEYTQEVIAGATQPEVLSAVPVMLDDAIAAKDGAAARTTFCRCLFNKPDEVPWSLYTYWRGMIDSSHPSVYETVLARTVDVKPLAELGKTEFPVMAVIGENDAVFDSKVILTECKRFFPNIKVEVIKGGSHAIFEQDTDKFVSLVKPFVEAH